MNKRPIFKVTGGVRMGVSFLRSFRVIWPFGQIVIYEDLMIFKIRFIPNFIIRFFWLFIRGPKILGVEELVSKKTELKFKDIGGFRDKKTDFFGHSFFICHGNESVAPFLNFWVPKKKAKGIKEFLISKEFSETVC